MRAAFWTVDLCPIAVKLRVLDYSIVLERPSLPGLTVASEKYRLQLFTTVLVHGDEVGQCFHGSYMRYDADTILEERNAILADTF